MRKYKNNNPKWPHIFRPCQISIIGGSESGKTNTLLNLISQPDIDKIYLYAKNLYETKYQLLINKFSNLGLKYYNDPKAFIEYLNDMQDVYKNIEEYNLRRKRKLLIVFDDVIAMIANMISNKTLIQQ